MLALVLNCIDRLNDYNSAAHFAEIAREENGTTWKEILNLLYKLLGKFFDYSAEVKKKKKLLVASLPKKSTFVSFILSC